MLNIRMQHQDVQKLSPKITVIGVGGAGGNAVNNMISSGLEGCEFVVCNTDAQALDSSLCEKKLQLGVTVTGGLGAGAKPEIGQAAAEESLDDVMQYLEGANMAFITAGMGGGTGTGAAPVIARACREKGILTVGVVTKPFHFEGTLRMKMAEDGLAAMQGYVDTLIVIPNQNLFRIANEKTTFAEAFKMADSVLQSGVRGVTDLMVMPGLINLDFADIRSAMLEMGKAMMGTGEASGDRRAIEAAESAVNNPLLDDVSMKGARGVIINVTGGLDMTLFEVDEACNRIREEVDPDANIIFGSTFDEQLEGIMRVSVVATGIDVVEERAKRPTSGSMVLNTITTQQQQDRKPERARPNTEEVAGSQRVSAPVGSGVEVPQRIMTTIAPPQAPVVPVRATTSASVAYKQEDEPDSDMFEQQDLVVETQADPFIPAPRAELYKDSFIPPPPMQSDRTSSAGIGVPVQPDLLSARRPQATTNSGLTLKPPVPGAATQQKRRTPSLFERFTNPLRTHSESDTGETSGEAQGSGGSAGFRPSQQPLDQGALNIDNSAAQTDGQGDNELDIPAFLRRQAN